MQIINELNKFDNYESYSSKNARIQTSFDSYFKLLKLLVMILTKSTECLQENFDILTFFSSKQILFEKLRQINTETSLKNKILIEFSKGLDDFTSGKIDIAKKTSKRIREFNTFLLKFFLLQREKFLLTNLENKLIKRIDSLYQKISMNEININYTKYLINQKVKEKEKIKEGKLKKIPKNPMEFLPNILIYENKIQKRLEKINQFLKNIILDSMILTIKFLYLGPFNIDYQRIIIAEIHENFLQGETSNISKIWFENNEDIWSKYYKFLLEICDIYAGNYKFFSPIPLHFIYELNFLLDVLKILNLVLWDPLNIFSSLSLSRNLITINEPIKNSQIEQCQNENTCIIFHYRDPFLINDSSVITLLMKNYIIIS